MANWHSFWPYTLTFFLAFYLGFHSYVNVYQRVFYHSIREFYLAFYLTFSLVYEYVQVDKAQCGYGSQSHPRNLNTDTKHSHLLMLLMGTKMTSHATSCFSCLVCSKLLRTSKVWTMEWQAPQQMAPIRSPPRDAYAPFVEFTSKKGNNVASRKSSISVSKRISVSIFVKSLTSRDFQHTKKGMWRTAQVLSCGTGCGTIWSWSFPSLSCAG